MREPLRRIHYLLNRRRFDRELADELAFHREMAKQTGGMPLGEDKLLETSFFLSQALYDRLLRMAGESEG